MSFFTRNLWTGLLVLFAAAILVGTGVYALADDNAQQNKTQVDTSASKSKYFKPTESTTSGSVTAAGVTVPYKAVAGTLVVHPKDWDDAAPAADDKDKKDDGDTNPTAEASMFYVAYFKDGAPAENRPITFLYNGGPGSSTVWLHMGAFGPKRVVTPDDTHTPAAPYQLVDNAVQPARRQRPRLHRRAGHGLQPHRRQGQGEGVLRRRSRRARLRRVHQAVPLQVRPLELAEVPVRRELRHAALGGRSSTSWRPTTPSTSTA